MNDNIDEQADEQTKISRRDSMIMLFKIMFGPLVALALIFFLWGYRSYVATKQMHDFYSRVQELKASKPEEKDPVAALITGQGDSEAKKAEVIGRHQRLKQVLDKSYDYKFSKLIEFKKMTDPALQEQVKQQRQQLESELSQRTFSRAMFSQLCRWLFVEMLFVFIIVAVFPALHFSCLMRLRAHGYNEPVKLYFTRRFVLCALIAAGWLYVFSPHGIGGSAVEKYIQWSDSLLFSDVPHWMNDLHEAPLLCYGFLGFYIYALTLWLGRYFSNDITDSVYISLIRRAFIVMIISLILSYDPNSDAVTSFASKMTVFLIGVFPQTWITVIKKKVEGFSTNENDIIPLSRIKGLSMWQESRLEEEGINSVEDLVDCDVKELRAKITIKKHVLYKWCDQGMLIRRLDADTYDKLRKSSISSATELVKFVRQADLKGEAGGKEIEELEKATGLSNVRFLADILEGEPNFACFKQEQAGKAQAATA
jgi:hypothetical protein